MATKKPAAKTTSGSRAGARSRAADTATAQTQQTQSPNQQGKPPVEEAPPLFFPTTPEGQLAYVIGDLIKDKSEELPLGDPEMLRRLVEYVVRLTKDLPYIDLQALLDDAEITPFCVSCATCQKNFTTCTLGYTQCKKNYDSCVSCPCT